MVTTSSLWGRIRSIELELDILKAKVREAEGVPEVGSFADLCGIARGEFETTEEDIEAVEYRFGWEDCGDD